MARKRMPGRTPARTKIEALLAVTIAIGIASGAAPAGDTPRPPTPAAEPAGGACGGVTAAPVVPPAARGLEAADVVPPGQENDPRFTGLAAARERLARAARAVGVVFPLEAPALRIEKGARRIALLSGGKEVRSFRAGLGFAPEGQKEREGDGRTPEGRFYVCTRNPKSRYHLFLGLSYPRAEDAARGLAAGRIDAATAAKVSATARPACPPWETPLGGAVGIHGRGASRDWTLGCIALEDADMDELWLACPLGTDVEVAP
jgi:hypothetical protein